MAFNLHELFAIPVKLLPFFSLRGLGIRLLRYVGILGTCVEPTIDRALGARSRAKEILAV